MECVGGWLLFIPFIFYTISLGINLYSFYVCGFWTLFVPLGYYVSSGGYDSFVEALPLTGFQYAIAS